MGSCQTPRTGVWGRAAFSPAKDDRPPRSELESLWGGGVGVGVWRSRGPAEEGRPQAQR